MMYVRFPLSLRNVEDLLHERGIDVSINRSVSGGADFARYLLLKSDGSVSTGCERTPTCNGILTKSS